MAKYVYLFEEGGKELKPLLGSKGANLAEMSRIGLPVPPGFIVTTRACLEYLDSEGFLSDSLKQETSLALSHLETVSGRKFDSTENTLLLSVRSGAKISMPGMMETILNLGLNDETVKGLIKQTGDSRFAYDSYRRLISMFGDVAFGIEKKLFEEILTAHKNKKGAKLDLDLEAQDWQEIIDKFKQLYIKETGRDFPQNPMEQLWHAVEAVFKSWNVPRAVTYRKHHGIPHDLGTAVNIQMMVFGNMGYDSATGVAFTRNPATGENGIYGEYLVNAQGEDVVAGIRTPEKILTMKQKMPQLFYQLEELSTKLERHYKEMQDIEFTIEKEKLYMLQTRTGKRTAQAAVKIAVDFVKEGVITEEDALLQLDANQLPQILVPRFNPEAKALKQADLLGTGLGASPGAATGKIVFDPDEAKYLGEKGENVILTRPETVPDDIHGIIASKGILTTRGGTTSHAAVVARGMGKPCVSGCETMTIDLNQETLTTNGHVLRKGDIVSLDGATGEVFLGELPTEEAGFNEDLETVMHWADKYRTLGVRANADTPEDAIYAGKLGAKGIGLCRTEHMFMASERLNAMQKMILSDNAQDRQKYLDKLRPMQYEDFKRIFKAMAGYPVTIRLLDPPLHEFLPNIETLVEEVTSLHCTSPQSSELVEKERILQKVRQLKESNPMLGFRGCRVGLVYPEINEMQVRAIFEAAIDISKEGFVVQPEIMIPLVGTVEELKWLRYRLEAVAEKVMDEKNHKIDYMFGTMIEVPRAALVADKIAMCADFFSFGTNDLTQMTFGYSRDDAEGKFLKYYMDQGILSFNPFETIDTDGVGELIILAKQKALKTNSAIKLGICGEHGGEALSVAFCHKAGLNYVSCSPYRIPVARVAGAQAAIMQARVKGQPVSEQAMVSV